ncbi:AcrR family transcriptional regulator [Mycolicibacterium sp. BK634]|uniref:TetR family transcriptional regulator n=1 Tax=Mycobacteriaceae TaxID=1762 RepID=UPI0010D05BCB|nr:TetR family transcriptional regulator [Mycobacterium sp. BK086]MBB3748712.1 AcrR family transcriptional regulator [Mycolicibacterium sp. BK634]TDO15097.1 TetR family transcriptional regulator [Mycobacterium sp. BK086]
MSPAKDQRTDRSSVTRDALLVAAERLFAEHGMHAVSNRQISEAAGQGNNAAACYHFGSRADLLRAIEARHRIAIDEIRQRKLDEITETKELRDWIGVLVYPFTEHLEALGTPTSYARFAAQAMADPTYRDLVVAGALTSELMLKTVRGINRCLPERPKRVRLGRWMMASNLLMHTCAEIEGELAIGKPSVSSNWSVVAEELITALVGLWEAPPARIANAGSSRDADSSISV